MADVPSAVAYGTAAQGQAVYATGPSTAVWAYSPWDTTTVTAAAGTGAGTTAPAPVVGTAPVASMIRGGVTWGTGTATSAAAQLAVTFGSTFPSTPVVTFSPTTTATGTLNTFITSVGTTGFTISCTVAPSPSQANTVYGVNWIASL